MLPEVLSEGKGSCMVVWGGTVRVSPLSDYALIPERWFMIGIHGLPTLFIRLGQGDPRLKLPSAVHQTEIFVDIRDGDLRVRPVQLKGEVRWVLADRNVDRRTVRREMRRTDI